MEVYLKDKEKEGVISLFPFQLCFKDESGEMHPLELTDEAKEKFGVTDDTKFVIEI